MDPSIVQPIKHKILVYNGFPFHYEMIGFILDFSKTHNIEVDVVLSHIDNGWIEVYKTKYTFHILSKLPLELDYSFVLLLTDDDRSFPNSIINENTVCIDHYYQNRRDIIKHHIPIAPFNDDTYLYAFPIFDYITYEDKMDILSKHKRPIITILGSNSLPYEYNTLSIIDNINEFDIYIINRSIPKQYINLPNVFLFENISATKLFELLIVSTYMCYIPNNSSNAQTQKKCHSISASEPLSFTTGCKLMIPVCMNKYLRLTSIVEYVDEVHIVLDKTPSMIETFHERDRLITIRDKSLFQFIV